MTKLHACSTSHWFIGLNCRAAGYPIVPAVSKTLHYVPPDDTIGTLARVMTYVVFGVMGLTVIVAVAAGMASPGQSSTGMDG